LAGGTGQGLVGQPGWPAQVQAEVGAQLSQLAEDQLPGTYGHLQKNPFYV